MIDLLKIVLFTVIQILPLVIWQKLYRKKGNLIDWRLILSYFLVGSWFGMLGELFLYQLVDFAVSKPIWEYRLWPIHDNVTSAFGPIMWGMAAVYIGFHKHYPLIEKVWPNRLVQFVMEAVYLMILEVVFNFVAYGLFQEYYFYYFVPDLWHWTSFSNIPFWWMGYHVVAKLAEVFNREEKISVCLAILIIVVVLGYGN